MDQYIANMTLLSGLLYQKVSNETIDPLFNLGMLGCGNRLGRSVQLVWAGIREQSSVHHAAPYRNGFQERIGHTYRKLAFRHVNFV
jgi:hypothetical protein